VEVVEVIVNYSPAFAFLYSLHLVRTHIVEIIIILIIVFSFI